jgi:D-citramalate synthase
VNGTKHIASGSGNGGFDAFIDAINKVMKLHNYSAGIVRL